MTTVYPCLAGAVAVPNFPEASRPSYDGRTGADTWTSGHTDYPEPGARRLTRESRGGMRDGAKVFDIVRSPDWIKAGSSNRNNRRYSGSAGALATRRARTTADANGRRRIIAVKRCLAIG